MWILPKGLTHMEQGLTTPGRNILLVDVKEAASPRYRNGSGMPAGFAAANARLVNSNGHVSQWDLRLSPDVPGGKASFHAMCSSRASTGVRSVSRRLGVHPAC